MSVLGFTVMVVVLLLGGYFLFKLLNKIPVEEAAPETKRKEKRLGVISAKEEALAKYTSALEGKGVIPWTHEGCERYRLKSVLECLGLFESETFGNRMYSIKVKRSSVVEYPNHTRVGECYYCDGDYLGECAYSLYKLVADNPKRFVHTMKWVGIGRYSSYVHSLKDKITGVTFVEDYSTFNMKSKVTEEEYQCLVGALKDYYEDRERRYIKLLQKRSELKMLRNYCKCEENK